MTQHDLPSEEQLEALRQEIAQGIRDVNKMVVNEWIPNRGKPSNSQTRL